MLCFCPTFWVRAINIYLVLSAFTYRPTFLLASNKASVFFFMVVSEIYALKILPLVSVRHALVQFAGRARLPIYLKSPIQVRRRLLVSHETHKYIFYTKCRVVDYQSARVIHTATTGFYAINLPMNFSSALCVIMVLVFNLRKLKYRQKLWLAMTRQNATWFGVLLDAAYSSTIGWRQTDRSEKTWGQISKETAWNCDVQIGE
jgi:hypothetical protein